MEGHPCKQGGLNTQQVRRSPSPLTVAAQTTDPTFAWVVVWVLCRSHKDPCILGCHTQTCPGMATACRTRQETADRCGMHKT